MSAMWKIIEKALRRGGRPVRIAIVMLWIAVLPLLISPVLVMCVWMSVMFYDCNAELLNRLSALCGMQWAGLPHVLEPLIDSRVSLWVPAIFFDVLCMLVWWSCKEGLPRNRVLRFVKQIFAKYMAED